MSLAKLYEHPLRKKWCLRFKTNHPDGDMYDGIVLANRKRYIVLKSFHDFESGGIVTLPKKHITGYRNSKFEKTYNRILRDNSQYKNIKAPGWLIECNSIREVFEAIKKHKIWPSIEAIAPGSKESYLYIGQIQECGPIEFSIYCYDATARWEGKYNFSYEQILKIEINDSYTMHFNRYMKKYNPLPR